MPRSRITENELENLSDEELFSLSLSTPSLFGRIFDRYHKVFIRKAKHITKNEDMAEDVVQDTFVKIYRFGDKFTPNGIGSFKAWAYKILMNTAFTHYEKIKSKETVLLSTELSEILPDDMVEKEQIGRETRNYVISIFSRMPKHFSNILNEFFIKGKSQEEIARENNISLSAVKVRIYRAKESFRQSATTIN